jgi:hypothetical protein
MSTWPFPEPPDLAVVTMKQIMEDHQPILYVSHERDEDGEPVWQFLPGQNRFEMADALIVGLGSVVRLDPTLSEIADLPIGYAATRDRVGGPWVRRQES